MVSYMQYEPFYQKSNMAADAMLDFKKYDISETAEDRNLVLVSILLFYSFWKSSNMMLYVCSISMYQ